MDGAVISSVGSDWVFGLGNQYSVYWKLGASNEFTGSASGDSWHVYAGTLDASGQVNLLKDGYSVIQQSVQPGKHQTTATCTGWFPGKFQFLDF